MSDQPVARSREESVQGLADPTDARSNCGVGVVMDLDGGADHSVVADGIELLIDLEHRGALGAERDTGDGAGIIIQTPHAFFADELDIDLPEPYAVGSVFLPQDGTARAALRDLVEDELVRHGLTTLHWRDVPTENEDLGRTALDSEPHVAQIFVAPEAELSVEAFDQRLYVGRRAIENRIQEENPAGSERFYICSLDRKTLVYKGLLKASQLPSYYPELRDERVESTFVMVHARFSTNTLGAWHLAHPYRSIIHNGEINTIQGNINWMRARETDIESDAFDVETIKPIIDDPDQSDTASVDNAVELLLRAGRDLPHALRMLVPEAWRNEANRVGEKRQAWYDFHASLVEPWDGPALVCATDGDQVAAVLDRNGLRPCRYEVTTDNRLVMASEVGALETPPDELEERGRLKPGQLFLADPERGRIVPDEEGFADLVDDRYGQWVAEEQVRLEDLADGPPRRRSNRNQDRHRDREPAETIDSLRSHQALYGYTYDELDNLLEPMATKGKDPVGSMGDDTPLSVLSEFNRPLFTYFKQLFAQVSNPPLDYLRENLVVSLESRLGFQRNLLSESPDHARQLVLDSPILTNAECEAIKGLDVETERGRLRATTIDVTYDADGSLDAAVERVREDATDAVENGYDVVVLSDRRASADRIPIPSLLATGGVHHHLVRNGLRNRVGIVLESADPREVHHVCTLVGYGADAINPYLAYRTIADLVAGPDGVAVEAAIDGYVHALEDGLQTVMAKMGISTMESYQGAQIFEAVGLSSAFVVEYFEGTTARTEGIGIAELESDLRRRHEVAFGDDPEIERQGEYEHRSDGIHHQWNPKTVGTLQKAVRSGDYGAYEEFAAEINDQHDRLQTLRGLLAFNDSRESIPIEEVEPVSEIVQRFMTGSMSLGSLSPEVHENNAIAMNRLGAQSGTGEGGEPPERFGTEKECNSKQVASGRFGVTSNYLSNADVIQIKMAQGSKPGEGGHLPGSKVNEMVAHVRHATPGVGLISPPPLHDIYSIEDLKQLIHDLKTANEDADIDVKLVSEAGVGIIAAGVAKANADIVQISGHSGGTGASARTSIKNAGLPWELGVAEANQMLRETRLRSQIELTVDGGLKTGRDVAIAALLGAEKYGFGTSSLVSSGCVMARICHTNNCPTGVATQKDKLRERFSGEPEHVINYMAFIAQELREIMAELGFRSVAEMIGRVDVLRQREDVAQRKAELLDLSELLTTSPGEQRTKTREQAHREVRTHIDRELIDGAGDALENRDPVRLERRVTNADRAVGAMLSNRISRRYGDEGLEDDTITVEFEGTAGQSFGAFLANGVTMGLTGAANDYVGKGLSGGEVTRPYPLDGCLRGRRERTDRERRLLRGDPRRGVHQRGCRRAILRTQLGGQDRRRGRRRPRL